MEAAVEQDGDVCVCAENGKKKSRSGCLRRFSEAAVLRLEGCALCVLSD